MSFLIGIDIGTTNIKAFAMADDGLVLAQHTLPTRTLSPFPGAAEQSPLHIWKQLVRVVKSVIGDCPARTIPAGLVLSGAMHSLFVSGKTGQPLCDAWLWSDLRAEGTARALRRSDAGLEVYRRTGTPVHAMSPLVKIQWMRASRPDLFDRAFVFSGIKDFVLQKMTGRFVTEASSASATGLLNTRNGTWEPFALSLAGIEEGRLPEVVSPESVFPLDPAPAAQMGLPAGLPVVAGASDGALANLGAGVLNSKDLAITIGTSAAVRSTVDNPVFDILGRTFCYRLDDEKFVAGGASNNGSNVIDRLRGDVFQSRKKVAALLDEAASVPPGSDGLMIVPYFQGERAPVWDARATAVFAGMRTGHTRAHVFRAALEGVALNLRLIAGFLPELGGAERIHLSGGASRSALWQQVLADVFQLPVHVPKDRSVDGSALGAILMGRRALKLSEMPLPGSGLLILPRPENFRVYADSLERFAEICALTVPGHSEG